MNVWPLAAVAGFWIGTMRADRDWDKANRSRGYEIAGTRKAFGFGSRGYADAKAALKEDGGDA